MVNSSPWRIRGWALRGDRPVACPLAGVDDDRLPGQNLVNRDAVSTCNSPFSTTVYSSNSGVCPGSRQPDGLIILRC